MLTVSAWVTFWKKKAIKMILRDSVVATHRQMKRRERCRMPPPVSPLQVCRWDRWPLLHGYSSPASRL
jgi:hypothetical protein